MSGILTGGDIAALRPFGDNGFRVGDRFYSVREMLDTIARAAARVAELEARFEQDGESLIALGEEAVALKARVADLEAQVAQLREALVEADRQMDIASTIGCIKAQGMVRAALAATAPAAGEEATSE